MKIAVFIFLIVCTYTSAWAQAESPRKAKMSCKEIAEKQNSKTQYEFEGVKSFKVYDQHGELVIKGVSDKVDMSEMKKGTYFIAYDDKRIAFKKE